MDAEKLINIVKLTRKIKKQQDEAQVTLHKMVFALARQHLKENEVKQTIGAWSSTVNALKQMLGDKQRTGVWHGTTRTMRVTHIRIFDLKPVRVRCTPGGGFHHVREPGRSEVVETIDAVTLAERYISIDLEEE